MQTASPAAKLNRSIRLNSKTTRSASCYYHKTELFRHHVYENYLRCYCPWLHRLQLEAYGLKYSTISQEQPTPAVFFLFRPSHYPPLVDMRRPGSGTHTEYFLLQSTSISFFQWVLHERIYQASKFAHHEAAMIPVHLLAHALHP